MADNRSDWGAMDILDTLAVVGEESLLSDLQWHRANIRATLHLIRALRAWKVAGATKAETPAAKAEEAAPIYTPNMFTRKTNQQYWAVFRRVRELVSAGSEKSAQEVKDEILPFLRSAGYELVDEMTDDVIIQTFFAFKAEQDAGSQTETGGGVAEDVEETPTTPATEAGPGY